jgi:two-component system response regulator DesR
MRFFGPASIETIYVVGILVADDNVSTLKAIVRFLEDERYRVIGSVHNGADLVNQAMALQPDVAVVDIVMPEMSGLEALIELTRRNSGTRVVVLTAHREPEFVQAVFSAGGFGYVLKHRMVTDLPSAIDATLRGERFLSPPLASIPH